MISVIVPVYNVEKTLDRCINSILNQTFKDFEIILVNDGSTDGSGRLCDEYAKRYNNIKVIHKENEGLGPTRNRGIIEAQGEYIYHCDSDDWIKEDLLEKAYNRIEETGADFVIFGYEIFTEKNGEILPFKNVCLEDKLLVEKNQIQKEFVDQYFTSFVMMSACNRLYRKSFIIEKELFFPSLRRSQDMAYSFSLFDKAQKVAIIDKSFYCYIIQPGVYKGRFFDEMINILLCIFDSAKQTFESWGLLDNNTNAKLNAYVCENIANYSAYALAVKYKENWKENVKKLCCNIKIRQLFKRYKNYKKSKFMAVFRFGIILRSKTLLKILANKLYFKENK